VVARGFFSDGNTGRVREPVAGTDDEIPEIVVGVEAQPAVGRRTGIRNHGGVLPGQDGAYVVFRTGELLDGIADEGQVHLDVPLVEIIGRCQNQDIPLDRNRLHRQDPGLETEVGHLFFEKRDDVLPELVCLRAIHD
jgi:hypothetical protein